MIDTTTLDPLNLQQCLWLGAPGSQVPVPRDLWALICDDLQPRYWFMPRFKIHPFPHAIVRMTCP